MYIPIENIKYIVFLFFPLNGDFLMGIYTLYIYVIYNHIYILNKYVLYVLI